jgi:hypothetical protein
MRIHRLSTPGVPPGSGGSKVELDLDARSGEVVNTAEGDDGD